MAIVFIRTLIVFFAVIIIMRLLGKRQLGELELSELVVAVIISDLAANPLQDIGIPLLNGIIPIITLFCCEIIISALTVRSVTVRKLLCGKPSILVASGKIDQAQMRKNRFTVDELTEELRGKGVLDISTVKYAVLETDGSLSVILVPGERPLTAAQGKAELTDAGYPCVVINDGKLLDDNLTLSGRDERWLRAELKKRHIRSEKDVYLMTVDGMGQVYLSGKEST